MSIGIPYECGIVGRMVIFSDPGLAVVLSTGFDSRIIELVHDFTAFCNKPNVHMRLVRRSAHYPKIGHVFSKSCR